MANLIAVVQEKGGVRKSSIAVPYAKYKNIPYYTNDRHYSLARALLPEDKVFFLSGGLDIPKKGIFDLAGATDRELIIKLLPLIDLWVIPLSDSLMDYIPMLEIIRDLFVGHEHKISFVITGSDKKDAKELEEAIKSDFPKNSIFYIGNSKYAKNMLAEQKSILDYENAGGLAQYLTKGIRAQYMDVFNYFNKA